MSVRCQAQIDVAEQGEESEMVQCSQARPG